MCTRTFRCTPAAALRQPSGWAFLPPVPTKPLAGGLFFANDTSRPPEMDPNRKISEQDCSKPLDYSLGNIRCK